MRDPRVAVILAAGRGTRMRTALPKVLHRVAGRPLLHWVMEAARAAGCERLVVVVGHGAEAVQAAFPASDLTWVVQAEQRGTGHALAQAEEAAGGAAQLLVLSGDVPLLRATTLEQLYGAAEEGGAMAVARLAQPGALGRVEAAEGALAAIVEAADATPEELSNELVNAGIYLLSHEVFARLREIRPANAQGELYLTDAIVSLAASGKRVALVELADPEEALGVNGRRDLAVAHAALLRRRVERALVDGVTVLDPEHTVIEPSVEIAPDVVVHPAVHLLGSTRVGRDTIVHAGCWLRDCEIGQGVELLPYSVLDGAVVGDACRLGPFARLRPKTRLATGVRVGNFVEIKASELGAGAKVGHLSYVGDAVLGERVNVGAGVVTCNYDGVRKHSTEVGDDAFLGSDTMLVAPVRVGSRATTAAGSVVTRDVPDGALAVARARQRNVAEWTARRPRPPNKEQD